MNTKNMLLGVFVMLTVVFASLALSEYYQIGNLTSSLGSRTRTTETVLNTNALMVSRACTYSAEGSLILTVDNGSSGKPIGSVPVQVAYVATICSSTVQTSLGTVRTNGSGIVIFCCELGQYYFNVSYFGNHYSFIATVEAQRTTCVTLRIPSGDLTVFHSATFTNSC